jgi:hypothetical protein
MNRPSEQKMPRKTNRNKVTPPYLRALRLAVRAAMLVRGSKPEPKKSEPPSRSKTTAAPDRSSFPTALANETWINDLRRSSLPPPLSTGPGGFTSPSVTRRMSSGSSFYSF